MPSKITDLTADAAPTSTDIIATVDDIGGTPTTKKVALSDLAKGLDVSSLTAATVATGDLVMVSDIDDSNLTKKVTAQSIADLAAGASLTVAESDGTPSVASVTTIDFDQVDGFTVTDDTGGAVTVGFDDAAITQTLTNKTLTSTTNDVAAKSLHSATTVVDVSAATAPTTGQVLTATASTTATWQTPAGSGITWNEETGTSATMAVNNGYISSNAALVTFTLPDTAALGSVIRVTGKGAGGWKIAQNASESIIWNESTSTTTGTGGSLESTDDYDSIEILCTVADVTWTVLSSKGNITVT